MDDNDEAERRRSIMAEVRERHADRLARAEQNERDGVERREHYDDSDDGLTVWRKSHAEAERRRKQAEAERRKAEARAIEHRRPADVDARIAAVLKQHTAAHNEAIGRVIAAERARYKALLARERAALDLTIETFLSDLEKRLGGDRGTVVDLPAIPLRRRRVA